jgi:hypothetical protein
MKMRHTPYHWILVGLIVVAFLLTLSQAYGQSTGAAALFEGRPALAGAQGGQGAQAGPPQGGIGVQGSQSAERSLHLRKPSGLEDTPPRATRDDNLNVVVANDDVAARQEVLPGRDHMRPGRDQSLAKDQRSAVQKTKRAAKRTISRARHGVAEIDSASGATTR